MSETLDALVANGAEAYIRYLIATERAVLQGNFNGAKTLRALAYSHRAVAMNAARADRTVASVAETLSSSLIGIGGVDQLPDSLGQQLEQVHERQATIASKAIDSLVEHADVPEWVIAPHLRTCLNCGNIVEGDKPETCDICHVLGTEFESFGPFYASDAEHLGQLAYSEIKEIQNETVLLIEALITDVNESTLSTKPSPTEWSVKELIGHIIETDTLFQQRMDTILTGARYEQSLPPWKLHQGKGYNEMPAAELVDLLKSTRSRSIARIENLTPQEWATTAVMFGGTRSLLDTGTWIANHDRGHVAQIERLLGV